MQLTETTAVHPILRTICNQVYFLWSNLEGLKPNASDTYTSTYHWCASNGKTKCEKCPE